jgi:hypothetical protein
MSSKFVRFPQSALPNQQRRHGDTAPELLPKLWATQSLQSCTGEREGKKSFPHRSVPKYHQGRQFRTITVGGRKMPVTFFAGLQD